MVYYHNADIATDAHTIKVYITNRLSPPTLTNKAPISSITPTVLIPPIRTNKPARSPIVV